MPCFFLVLTGFCCLRLSFLLWVVIANFLLPGAYLCCPSSSFLFDCIVVVLPYFSLVNPFQWGLAFPSCSVSTLSSRLCRLRAYFSEASWTHLPLWTMEALGWFFYGSLLFVKFKVVFLVQFDVVIMAVTLCCFAFAAFGSVLHFGKLESWIF